MSIHHILNNNGLPHELADIDAWPEININNISKEKRKKVQKIRRAIKLYVSGFISLRHAAQKTGVKPGELRRQLLMCLLPSPEGGILGFRALIPYKRCRGYTRSDNGLSNFSGFLTKLFNEYDEIRVAVLNELKGKGDTGEKAIDINDIHEHFLNKCREVGITDTEYPFNTTTKAREGLRQYLLKYMEANPEKVTYQRFGKEAGRKISHTATFVKPSITRPYEVVELDAHKCDAIFSIMLEDENGLSQLRKLHRIWLILAIDVASRAVLGYSISLNRECSLEDALEAIEKTVIPHKRVNLTIPNLVYLPTAGFPSSKIKTCQWHLYDQISLDNAKILHSDLLHQMVARKIGASVHLGEAGQPEGRPFVERVFGTLTNLGLKRTPTSTGGNPSDIKCQTAKKANKKDEYHFHYDDFLQLIDVLIANYNGTMHRGIHCSPLDYIRIHLKQTDTIHHYVPTRLRETWRATVVYINATIRGSKAKGKRPYVQYQNAKYSNHVLSSNMALIGKSITLKVDTKDLRTFEASLQDGEILGVLRAKGNWGQVKHSLKTRKLICRLVREGEIFIHQQDPIDVALKYLKKHATRTTFHANQYTRVLKESGITHDIATNTDTIIHESTFDKEDEDWIQLRKTIT